MSLQPGVSLSDEIDSMVRQELGTAGAEVVDETAADALLAVNMYMQCDVKGTSCGYHTMVELRQWTHLQRDPNANIAAVTWLNSYSGGIGKADLSVLPSQLRVDAGALLKGFVGDLRSANGH
jgi:hypothetical protein